MKKEYEALFTPWKIGNVEIKNRIVLAPMGGTCIFGWTEPNHFDKEAAYLLKTIADNNCGLIIPGIAPVKDIMGGAWLYQHKWKFNQLKKFMDEVHKTGAKLFIQMTAGFGRSMALSAMMTMMINNKIIGTIAKPIMDPEYLTTAPSALPNRWADDITTKEMTKKQIDDIIYAFGETARLCKEAGVDGVEVHAVHEGYLLDQFTLPYTNFRTDEYGGSFENRYRFPVEIVKAIKASCGEDFPVSLRYSVVSKTKGFQSGAMPGEDYVEVGRDMAESEKAAKYLQDNESSCKLTGLGLPSEMAEYIGDDDAHSCPYFYLWDMQGLGKLSALTTLALIKEDITGAEGETFTAGDLGEYTITVADDEGTEVVLGLPLEFNSGNIEEMAKLY